MKGSAVATLVLLAAGASPSFAQTASGRPIGRIEVDAGGGLLGAAALGAGEASLRANNPERQMFRLFAVDTELARAAVVHLRASVALSRRFVIEGGVTRSRPEMRTSVTADAEGAPPITMAGTVDQYFIDATLLVMVDALRVGSRLVPFVAGGGGYLRQLHEGRTVIEQGQVYHAGGGVKYWLLARNTGIVRTAGLRADVRAYLRRGGISFGDDARPQAAVSGSVFVGF